MSDLLTLIARDRSEQAFVQLFEQFASRLKAYMLRQGADAATAQRLSRRLLSSVDLMGVRVPRGRHTVSLEYRSTYFMLGASISLLALALCLFRLISRPSSASGGAPDSR